MDIKEGTKNTTNDRLFTNRFNKLLSETPVADVSSKVIGLNVSSLSVVRLFPAVQEWFLLPRH